MLETGYVETSLRIGNQLLSSSVDAPIIRRYARIGSVEPASSQPLQPSPSITFPPSPLASHFGWLTMTGVDPYVRGVGAGGWGSCGIDLAVARALMSLGGSRR